MNKKEISLIIADDHPMLLKGLQQELIANNYNVIGAADDGMKALELILKLKPTIALIDIDMPLLSGFEVVKMTKEKGINTKFIILSYHKEADYITQAKTLKIEGYLLKEDSFDQIENCITSVLNKQTFFSSSFDNSILKYANDEIKKIKKLTPSETAILKLIAQGISNTELANILGVSIRTVEKHRSNIVNKLDIAKETNSLTNWALTNKNMIADF